MTRSAQRYIINVKLTLLIFQGGLNVRNRITELRKEHRMTQQDLADKTEVSRQTIISLEKGKYDPSIGLAHKIAQIFHLKIEDVFLFEEDN